MSHDGVNELIETEIGHLVDEEISLAENCNFYTYQDIPKELVHQNDEKFDALGDLFDPLSCSYISASGWDKS